MAKFEIQLTAEEINRRLLEADEKHGASYFDPASNTMLYFATKETKEEWLSTGNSELVIDEAVMNFTGTMYQVKVQSEMPSKNMYFTTLADKAEITVSLTSQKKGITDTSYQDFIEDYSVSVYVDKGSTGSFTPLILDQFVMSGNSFTFDVRKALATGANRVRVVAIGSESNGEAQGSEMFIVNLTSMYLAPSNFTWYKPFVEGETYALGGVNIGGNLPKVLKIKVSKEGYERLYEVNIGSNIYTTTAYVFNGMEFPEAGTGVYNVEMWLDANGLESDHLSYNIICVAAADKFTAQLVAIGNPAKTVFNFSDNELFQYCIYNGGTATGTPHIKVAYIVNTNPTTIIDEDLVDVATASPLTYTASLEIEMEDESAALSLETFMNYGNEQMIVYPVDNSKSYPATTGAVFYLNPSARNNAQENREKIVNSINRAQIDATFTRMAWTDGTDGWTTDEEGRKCLRLPAGCTMEMDYSPLASVSRKTIEFVYKVKNAADYDEPIISICSDVEDPQFRGIKITPKNILLHSRDLNVNDSLQDYNTTDEETLHILVTIIPNYKTNYGNLAQIYCNGDKVRSFSFETADRWDVAANVKVGSETADVFLYKMRVYDRGFESYDALKNYINSLPSTKEKEEAKMKIEAPLDDSYKLSYDECVKNGLNTMVIEILDQDQTVPSIANPSAKQCNLWVKVHNPMDGELDADFARFFSGEMIENQTIEGQGTTAMTYARWNFRWKLGEEYNKRRITAKKNFASSMHSHKMGATRLFNDLHRRIVGANDADARVAVYQYPVYGFQKVLVEGTTDQYVYEPIGLYTIGPDKGDKPTFGYNNKAFKNTLIHMEGTDHTPKGVGFDYPYDELGYSGASEALGAINASGSVVAAWEVGAAGDYDPKDNPTEVKTMLDAEFASAYNIVERNSTYILGVTETLEEINADIADWQARRDAEDRSFADLEFFTDGVYDLYFYNTRTQRYEARGINMLVDLGLSSDMVNAMSLDEKTELFKTKRRERFVALWENYWDKNDSIFHYTFMLVFGATDNFKKNTYPYKFKAVSEGGKWRWRSDDLDTLFDINNQGLAAKIYSILVGDKTSTGSGSIYRGDTSVFWTLIRECFGIEIKAMVHSIFNAMVEMCPSAYGKNTLEKLVGCIRYYFWDKAQAYFPASAYSKDAEWTYEDTWAAGLYKEVNPLQQSLGGHKEAEIDWVTMRILFCAMFFNYGPFGAVNDSFSDTSTGQIAYGGAGAKKYLITMACDGNPTILRGQSELVTFGDRVKAGETIELTVPNSSGADTRIYIQGVDWMSDIGDLSDLQVSADNPQLSVASKRLQRLKLGDEDASKVTTNVQALNFGDCPSMMIVDARNAKSLTGSIDLSKMPRLMEAYFGGTGVKAVNVPNGSKIAVLELGEETTQISLMNLKFMAADSFREYEAELESTGKYYATNQGVGNKCTYAVTSDTNVAGGLVINLKDVNSITISGKGGNTPRLWCFLDANDIILSCAAEQASATNLKLTIPNNAVKCIVQFMSSTAYKIVINEGVKGGFKYTSLPKLEFLRIENCSQLNPFQMLKSIYNTDGNVIRDIRIIGFDVEGDASDVTMIANLANDLDKDGNPHIYNGIDADGKPIDNSHPVIEGRLSINGNIYEEDYNALKAVFANLAMEFLGFYVSFKDPEVLRILLEKITTDDGVGLTIEDVAKVTTISNWFKNNTSIESFDELAKFTSLTTLENANVAFYGCSNLKSIDLRNIVKMNSSNSEDSYGAFNKCSALESIGDTSGIQRLSHNAFKNCASLKGPLSFPALTEIKNGCFYASGIVGIESLGTATELRGTEDSWGATGVFTNCVDLEYVRDAKKIAKIGNATFSGCTKLSEVGVDWSIVITIGSNAFYNCTSLEFDELNLHSLTSLAQYAFGGVKIKKLSLGKVTTLPSGNYKNAFGFDATYLEEVILPNTLTVIPSDAFYLCESLSVASLPDTITSIGNRAFYGCSALSDVLLTNVATISETAFRDCGLVNVNLPSVTTMGSYAFRNNKQMQHLSIGDKVTSIGSYCFYDNTALVDIIIGATAPPTLVDKYALGNTNNCQIYVPAASIPSYAEASNWSACASRLAPLEDHEDGGYVKFADSAVEAICVANWDTNKSGYMSKNECAAVKDTGGAFQNKSEIISFNEFENFTGVELIGSTNYETEGTARFINCTNLESIRLPKSLKTIKGYSFKGCSKLKTNSLPVSLTYIGNNAFIGCDLDGLIVDVPNLTTLGNGAFAQTNIVRVENVGSITVVGTSTGNHESNGIFRACKELEFVRLPSTVTYLGVSTFYKCSALKEIVCEATTPPTLYATQVFEGTHTELAIYVPDEAVDTYKTATNWSQYASRIKPLSEYTE